MYHFALDVLAVASVLGFGSSHSAAVVMPVISAVTMFPSTALILWVLGTAWMATETSKPMQLPLQLLFTMAVLQRCKQSRR